MAPPLSLRYRVDCPSYEAPPPLILAPSVLTLLPYLLVREIVAVVDILGDVTPLEKLLLRLHSRHLLPPWPLLLCALVFALDRLIRPIPTSRHCWRRR